jgi:5-methyltetrahydropteroyltriglutamate--homocysteine methyltransferase
MRRSTERFLITHTGSLPRPDDLIRMMYAKEEGVPVDRAALAARVNEAVKEVVKKQADAGIDYVNDGEMSKPSYATYVKDRLAGFGGAGNTFVYQDLVDFPNLAKRVFGDPGRSRRKTPACNAPISVRDAAAANDDVAALKNALVAAGRTDAFMSAASPGVISLFFRNEHYKDHETYLFAIADAMRHEYETVAKAGFVLQIDCPDLAMGRHIQYADLDLAEFRKRAGMHIAALNHALANIPPEQLRMHLCWGNYEGPHHCDVPMADIIDVVLTDRIEVELHRASGTDRPAHRPLCAAGRPRERHGRLGLRLRHVGRPGGRRSRRGVGEVRGDGRGRPHRLARILEITIYLSSMPSRTCRKRA